MKLSKRHLAARTFVALLFLALGACSTRAPRREQTPTSTAPAIGSVTEGPMQGPLESFGPPMPPAATTFGPEPKAAQGVVLVLGPGMAKSFAHAGAIRALSEAKIKINAILGTELGGLLAGIYAVDGSLNHFEWSLVKLRPEIFTANGGAILSKVFSERGSSEQLERELRKILARRELQQSKIPLRLAVQDLHSGKVEILDRGEFVAALRGVSAVPGLFKPGRVLGTERVSAALSRPYLVREAKSLGLGPVLVIQTEVSSGAENKRELTEADLVIQPELKGVGEFDFEKRSEAAFQGKQAVIARLAEIRKLLGAK